MICVQFEIVCTLQIDFFLFCPQGKKRNIQLLGLLRTTSEIIENIFMSVFPSSYKMSISWLRRRDIIEFRKIYVKDLHWRQETLFAKDCIWNPPTPSIFFTMWRLLKFVVVFFIPFSMSKKVGSMCGVVCIRTRFYLLTFFPFQVFTTQIRFRTIANLFTLLFCLHFYEVLETNINLYYLII